MTRSTPLCNDCWSSTSAAAGSGLMSALPLCMKPQSPHFLMLRPSTAPATGPLTHLATAPTHKCAWVDCPFRRRRWVLGCCRSAPVYLLQRRHQPVHIDPMAAGSCFKAYKCVMRFGQTSTPLSPAGHHRPAALGLCKVCRAPRPTQCECHAGEPHPISEGAGSLLGCCP